MNAQGILSEESKSRLKLGLSIYLKKRINNIITIGWNYRKDSNLFISEVFKAKLIDMGINEGSIISEINSRDTVGDAYFSKTIAVKNKWYKLLIITSDYHVNRVKHVFKFIYGNKFEIDVIGIVGFNSYKMKEKEEESLNSFRSTFYRIKEADDIEIYNCLKQNHPYYNGSIYPKIQ